ncbi:multidrug efflux RND transporter permease subunit [soil metagenome]
MKLGHLFIDRPVLAAVISILVTILGIVAYPTLPVSQYPEIVPPTVTVSATYPGASAETLADTVANPIEQQINGVENMLYMSSSSTGDGRVQITVTFKLGTDLNVAQVLVQNRVANAQPRLPQQVQATGVVIRKSSPDFLLGVHFYSPDHSLDRQYVANFVTLTVRDQILRTPGVGDVVVRGQRDYSMRIWIDPDKAAARNLTVEEITSALQSHNVQIAAGNLNAPPFGKGGLGYQINIQAVGRLTTPAEFADIVIKHDDQGRITRVADVARVELGAQDYTSEALINGTDAVLLGILALPGSNALEGAANVKATVARIMQTAPPGLAYRIAYNPTDFIAESIKEVERTLFEALVLVVIVVILFLQTWRASIIPVLAIPISLIGTFAVMKVAGFSLNNLSLFGLVLAIGIVVDDAIVVVENVERHLREGMTPREAAYATMEEVAGALIAIALVLIAVFVPTALISGITGQFYRQFALTIATATLISLLVSLTLSPALAAIVLKPHEENHDPKPWEKPFIAFANGFNKAFAKLSDGYAGLVGTLTHVVPLMLVIYAALLGFTVWRLTATPTGFIPSQDQGNLIAAITLPQGASLERTRKVTEEVSKRLVTVPGVYGVASNIGVDATTNTQASNAAQQFIVLNPWSDREKHKQKLTGIIAEMTRRVSGIVDAQVRIIPPPPVRGIGTAGGFKGIIEDRNKVGYPQLEKVAQAFAAKAAETDGIGRAFISFSTASPRLFADIDRAKAEMLGVSDGQVFNALQTYLGSTYINDFTYLGYSYQVRAQADWPFRRDEANVLQLKTRSQTGAMVPLGSVIKLKHVNGPYRVLRYNLFPAAEIQGDTADGYSSGQSLDAMQEVAKSLPDGYGFEWTEIAFQETTAGNTGAIAFGMAVVFAFLVLAALYESVTLPLAVVLIVPMCLLAALLGVSLRGLDNNILTQVGLIVLIGLAAKNAILIVEFAKQGEDQHGLSPFEAAKEAARTRLRPILMTSFAFIFGVIPLAFATGAGAEMRQALGTAVFFGMIGVTVFGLIFTPVFYVAMRKVGDKLPKPKPPTKPDANSHAPDGDVSKGAAA